MQRHQHGGNIYEYGDVIDFSANINPLGMPSAVKEAAVQGVYRACHYPEAENRQLVHAIAEAENETGLDLADSQIICGNGAAELIFLLCRTIRPKKAMLFAPSFAEYAQALRVAGSRIDWIELREEDGFAGTAQTLAEMEDRMRESGKTENPVEMLFICQPNNPTGQLAGEAWMASVLALCRRYQIWLVLDACFLELLDEKELDGQRRMITECLKYNRGLVIKAFTKSYAMAGLRLGYLMGRDEACLRMMRDNLQPWNVSLPAQYAGLAALNEKEFLKESRHYLAVEKRWLLGELERVRETGLITKIYGHGANFIFFRAKNGLHTRMLVHGVLIRDCSNYEGLTEGYYRVAVRTREENRRLIRALCKEASKQDAYVENDRDNNDRKIEGGAAYGKGDHDTGNHVECR